MKRFRFRLSALLSLRKLREDQERARLLLARADSASQRRELERLQTLAIASRDSLFSRSSDVRFGPDLLFAEQCLKNLDGARSSAQASSRRMDQAVVEQADVYHQAHRELQILEQLHANALVRFRADEDRHEQQELDSLHLLTRYRTAGPVPSSTETGLVRLSYVPRDETFTSPSAQSPGTLTARGPAED